MDITIQILGVEGNVEDSAGKHIEGDIIGVYPLISDLPSKNTRLCLINISDVPINSINELAFLMDSLYDTNGEMVLRHVWHFDKALASEEGVAFLQTYRYINIHWNVAETLIKNKETNEFLTMESINDINN